MRLRPLAALSAAALLATTACVSTSEETRPQPRPSVSKEEVTPIETPDDAPEVTVVDTSPGGEKDTEPLWQGLDEAAENDTEAYLKVYVHTGNPEVPETGETTVTADSPDSVSVTVDAENVDDDLSPFLLIHGTFDVDEIGNSAYTLKTVDDEDIPELDPKGPDDEARCTADDAQDRIRLPGHRLAQGSPRREGVRQEGGGSPGERWGIQNAAISRGQEGGGARGVPARACLRTLQ